MKIPIFSEEEETWVVEVDGRIEKGDLLYIASEWLGDGLIYRFHNFQDGREEYHDHEHSFEEVINAALRNPIGFSINGFEEDYSQQERRILDKVRKRILVYRDG